MTDKFIKGCKIYIEEMKGRENKLSQEIMILKERLETTAKERWHLESGLDKWTQEDIGK